MKTREQMIKEEINHIDALFKLLLKRTGKKGEEIKYIYDRWKVVRRLILDAQKAKAG
jgi:hypothetical protein